MANPTYTLQQKINQLLQYKTQKQAAVILGISDRTIRRWKSGRVTKPAKKSSRAVKRLSKQSSYYRSVSVKRGAPKSLSIVPPIKRVPVKGAPISIYADVFKLDLQSIIDFIVAVTKQGKWVRFIVHVKNISEHASPEASTKLSRKGGGLITTHWYTFKGAKLSAVENDIAKVRSMGVIHEIVVTKP